MSGVIEFNPNWSQEHKEDYLSNAYLEMGDTYNLDIKNPINLNTKHKDIPESLVNLCMDENYLHFPTEHILNMNIFLRFQMLIFSQRQVES